MTRPKPLLTSSNVGAQRVGELNRIVRDRWMSYDTNRITTMNEDSWLTDTAHFGALSTKHEFVAGAGKQWPPALSNWASLCIKYLMDPSSVDFGIFSTKAAISLNIVRELRFLSIDDPYGSIDRYAETLGGKYIHPTDFTSGSDGGLIFIPVAYSSTASPIPTRFDVFAKNSYQDLCDALNDLGEACSEARDEGLPAPSDAAVSNARWLLHYMYELLPWRFEVYPTPDGEIAIDVPGDPNHSVLILCDSDGGAQYFGYFDGKQHFAEHSDAHSIVGKHLRVALAAMERKDSTAR